MGESKLKSKDRKNKTYVTAIISRKPHMIILPFVFIEWQNKQYGIEFKFGSYMTSLDKIDSVQYSVFDAKDSLLLTGTVCDISPNKGHFSTNDLVNTSIIKDTPSFAHCRTDYIYPLIIKKEPTLKVSAVAYIRDFNGNQKKFDLDSIKLVKKSKRAGSFF